MTFEELKEKAHALPLKPGGPSPPLHKDRKHPEGAASSCPESLPPRGGKALGAVRTFPLL